MQPYEYNKLNTARREIRLLDIDPWQANGLEDPQLLCSLRHVSLDDAAALQYETISYCWGSTARDQFLVVDASALSVPSSTYRTVHRLAHPDRKRTVWIDAVCIDEDDDDEKSQQIPLMRDIYRLSIGNVIDLGAEDDMVARAVSNMDDIAREIQQESRGYGNVEAMFLPNKKWATARNHPITVVDHDALAWFFRRPWFRRVWVVQEAVLASQNICLCGTAVVDFDKALTVAAWLYHYHAVHIPRSLYEVLGLENAAMIWERKRNVTGSMSITSALQAAQELEAWDPRDKVYGMLGIAIRSTSEIPDLLRPDYTKGHAEVLRDAVRYSIQEQGSLYILRYVSHRSPAEIGIDGFPSWVPRFDRSRGFGRDPALMPLGYRSPFGLARASNEARLEFLKDDETDAKILILHGVVISRLDNIYPAFVAEDTRRFWLLVFHLIAKSDTYKARFAKVLIADRNYRHENATEVDLLGFDRWLAHMKSGPGRTLGNLPDLPADANEALTEATKYHQAMKNAINHRRWATTRSGAMALVPKVAQTDDIVVGVEGGDTPYVLRSSGDDFIMIGDCYVEWNMGGEVLDKQKADGQDLSIFRIR